MGNTWKKIGKVATNLGFPVEVHANPPLSDDGKSQADEGENEARWNEASKQVAAKEYPNMGIEPRNPQNFSKDQVRDNNTIAAAKPAPSGLGNDHSPVTFNRVDGGEM